MTATKDENDIFKFGEDVAGYAVPVLNEREIRASAGIMFLGLLLSFIMVLFRGNFLFVKYAVVVFFVDFMIRVFVNPKFSPLLIIGRLIVSRQAPEYVGAAQKKFAWTIGLALSAMMAILLVALNTYSPVTVISCLSCLVFLFFESAFGICLGCIAYKMLYKNQASLCAGEFCDPREKQSIQKISRAQRLVVFFSLVLVLAGVFFLNDYFSRTPRSFQEIIGVK